MVTPLYQFLKQNGTTLYVFPSVAEDISAQYQNVNSTMNFSKFILLNLPKQNLVSGTANNPVQFDFYSTFDRASLNQATGFSNQMVESLRNYVANEEITIKESKTGANEFYYNNNELQTPAEKIFWKWLHKLNVIDFEPAIQNEEYFPNLQEFQSNNLNDTSYQPEYLWKERSTVSYNAEFFYQTGTTFSNNLEVQYGGTTNFRAGDIVTFNNISNTNLIAIDGLQLTVLDVIAPGLTQGQRVVFDYTYTSTLQAEPTGLSTLDYNKVVQYIGEIASVNNVQEGNDSYTQVYAMIADHNGATPDILFRTEIDTNYKPNLTFPILPSQYQPEIVGAEQFSSPIVNTPASYPGDYYGQFDTPNFTYLTSSGDSLRRTGDYYGVSGNVNNPIFDPTNIDGVMLDFDTTHYVKMNIINQEAANFDEFDSLPINGQAPKNFNFNAILWYYTVTDAQGNSATNLYGISFLDSPQNNPNPSLVGLQFPLVNKLVNDGTKDGNSFNFSTNLNFNIDNSSTLLQYNPNTVYGIFNFNLFNDAMTKLAAINNQFLIIVGQFASMNQQISDLRQLLYSQTQITAINSRIDYLQTLLNQLKSLQLVDSDTIKVNLNNSTSPPTLSLDSVDATYYVIYNNNTTDLYNTNGIIPLDINVPTNKNFLIRIINNDETNLTLPNNNNLTVVLDNDLYYRQSVDIIIDANIYATQNKKLDLYVTFNNGVANTLPVQTPLITDIDLPVYINSNLQTTGISKNWRQQEISFNLSGTQSVLLTTGNLLTVPLDSNRGINKGDTFLINNFYVGLTNSINYAGQYTVDSVGTQSSYANFDITSSTDLTNFASTQILPFTIHSASASILNSIPYLNFNKGVKYKITRVLLDNTSAINDRYLIEKEYLE
jgi:hypothetical protein